MSDLNHTYGGDLIVDDCGGILWAAGTTELAQRLVRRFLTNPAQLAATGMVQIRPDYLFEPSYGAGARQYVDAPYTSTLGQTIQARFTDQIAEEPEVATSPPPAITVAALQSGVLTVNVLVTLNNGTAVIIPLEVSN